MGLVTVWAARDCSMVGRPVKAGDAVAVTPELRLIYVNRGDALLTRPTYQTRDMEAAAATVWTPPTVAPAVKRRGRRKKTVA